MLHVNLSAIIDVTLQVGQLADSITVSSEAPLLESEKADRGLVIKPGRMGLLRYWQAKFCGLVYRWKSP